MLENDFDPFQAMCNMDTNIQNLIKAHNALAAKVNEQSETIDVLIKGLNLANANSQALMTQLADLMIDGLNKVK